MKESIRRRWLTHAIVTASLGCVAAELPAQGPSVGVRNLPFRPLGSSRVLDPVRSPPDSILPPAPIVRQVAMQSGGFQFPGAANVSPPPPTGFNPMPGTASPAPSNIAPSNIAPSNIAPSNITPGPGVAPRSLPQNQPSPNSFPSSNVRQGPIPQDYQPIMPPQLANGGFATMADCRQITPPSGYTGFTPYRPPPAQFAAPAVMPPPSFTQTIPAQTVSGPTVVLPPAIQAAPAGSLVDFGQSAYPVQVGRGLWGQPVAYVNGQSVRNWLRYFSF